MTSAADEVRVSFDREEWYKIKRAISGNRPYIARVSIAIILRLLQIRDRGDDIYVLSAVDQLEGLPSGCRTKEEKRFKGQVLGRFWHKHFATPTHMLRNIGEHWGIPHENYQKLDTLINRTAKRHGNDPDKWPGMLSHDFMLGYQWRSAASELTGDWVIFGKHQDKNYYLDLATHEEGNDPHRLYSKLRAGSEAEFPFLFL
jgi:hypothetical protein